jgi:hypothetical protein
MVTAIASRFHEPGLFLSPVTVDHAIKELVEAIIDRGIPDHSVDYVGMIGGSLHEFKGIYDPLFDDMILCIDRLYRETVTITETYHGYATMQLSLIKKACFDKQHFGEPQMGLIEVARKGLVHLVDPYLMLGANIHAFHERALFEAVSYRNYPMITSLIAHGANLHFDDDHLLRMAVLDDDVELFHFLIRLGANLFAKEGRIFLEALRCQDDIIDYFFSKDWKKHAILPQILDLLIEKKESKRLMDCMAFEPEITEDQRKKMIGVFTKGKSVVTFLLKREIG